MKEAPFLIRYVRPIIALLVMGCAFGFMFLIAVRAIPGNNKEIVTLALGYVLGQVSIVAGYYFGTSKDKSDSEQTALKANTQVTQTTTVEDVK